MSKRVEHQIARKSENQNTSLFRVLSLWSSIFLAFWFSSSAFAYQFPFQDSRPLYIGSRPLSMGNTYVSIADEGEAGFWNPAGLIQWQGVKIFASAKMFDRNDYAFDAKCVAYSYKDIGFFWGNKIAFRLEPDDIEDFTYYSLAYKLNSYWAIGGSVKFKRRHPCDYYQFFGHSPAYDLGLLWKPDTENSMGLLIQNRSKEKYWVSVLVFGYTHKMSDNLLLSTDISIVSEDRISLELHSGLEYYLMKNLALRAGISQDKPTAGIGLRIYKFRIDYAWIRDRKDNTYFISGQF